MLIIEDTFGIEFGKEGSRGIDMKAGFNVNNCSDQKGSSGIISECENADKETLKKLAAEDPKFKDPIIPVRTTSEDPPNTPERLHQEAPPGPKPDRKPDQEGHQPGEPPNQPERAPEGGPSASVEAPNTPDNVHRTRHRHSCKAPNTPDNVHQHQYTVNIQYHLIRHK